MKKIIKVKITHPDIYLIDKAVQQADRTFLELMRRKRRK